MKGRILRELGSVFDSGEIIGFFSFVVLKTEIGKIEPTITFICDGISPEQREKIKTALLALSDTIKPVFVKEKHEG